MLDPVGFWSYARLDDEHSDGQLSQLRAVVGKAIGMQHGDKVTLWQDIQAIPYGADWEREIEETIGKTTFFIPIVTPRFLKSANCRDEYLSYRRRMLALGRDDLIFPVHYVSVDGLRPEDTVFGDDLATLRRAQWIDFRPLFYAAPKSAEVRRWAGEFAGGILQAMRREAPRRPMAAKVVERAAEASEPAHPAAAEPAPPAAVAQPAPAPSAPTESAPVPPREAAPAGRRAAWVVGALFVVVLVILGVANLSGGDKGANTASTSVPAKVIAARSPVEKVSPMPPTPTDRLGRSAPDASPLAPAPTVQSTASLVRPAVNLSPPSPAPTPSGACGSGLKPRATGVLSAAEECALKPKEEFKECADCPQMVVVRAGEFLMGSPVKEHGRSPDEGPQHRVTFASPFAVGKFPITVGEFKTFVAATNYDAGSDCDTFDYAAEKFEKLAVSSWRDTGSPQTDAQPATCVDWKAAQAYANWLSGKTGKRYRLPSEAEWEFSARGGTKTAYFWGDEIGKGNFKCDQCGATSAVGSFEPNGFGLYDITGNVRQWTMDCYRASYDISSSDTASSDRSPQTSEDCSLRVVRGGSWHTYPYSDDRSAARYGYAPDSRDDDIGFRVVRALTR